MNLQIQEVETLRKEDGSLLEENKRYLHDIEKLTLQVEKEQDLNQQLKKEKSESTNNLELLVSNSVNYLLALLIQKSYYFRIRLTH